jgi:hypothetical protein
LRLAIRWFYSFWRWCWLGLGWNFGLICGTAAIVDATLPQIRAKMQGRVDVLIAFVGASGGALSGMVVSQSSYSIPLGQLTEGKVPEEWVF